MGIEGLFTLRDTESELSLPDRPNERPKPTSSEQQGYFPIEAATLGAGNHGIITLADSAHGRRMPGYRLPGRRGSSWPTRVQYLDFQRQRDEKKSYQARYDYDL